MQLPKKYLAAPVPRFLRTARLSYLPTRSIIGSQSAMGADGGHLIFDIVMLPVEQFQRMRSNVGLQHVAAPAPRMGPELAPSFVLADVRQVVVPGDESDPESFARDYFIQEFGLIMAPVPTPQTIVAKEDVPEDEEGSHFAKTARECTTGDESESR